MVANPIRKHIPFVLIQGKGECYWEHELIYGLGEPLRTGGSEVYTRVSLG